MNNLGWEATLSDGTTVVEHEGEYQIVPGERKPWVRLTEFTATNGLYLTSLRLKFKNNTINIPSLNFDRFGLQELSKSPTHYSLQYLMEATMGNGGGLSQESFIDLIAHFQNFEVHYLQDIESDIDGHRGWIVVTEGYETLSPSPLKK